ncbi:MAG: hypothetical protein ACOC8Q_02150, partial [Desulfosalsimonas sp.]
GSARLQLLAGPHAMRPQSPPRLSRMVLTCRLQVYRIDTAERGFSYSHGLKAARKQNKINSKKRFLS